MNFQLVTLSGVMLEEPIYEAIIPTTSGEIAVYPGHEPLVSVVKPGIISVRRTKHDTDAQMEFFAITGGVAEISTTAVRILVDEADSGEDIIESESKAALERAIKLRDNAQDQVELDKAHQLVDRHAVRLKVAELHRQRRTRR